MLAALVIAGKDLRQRFRDRSFFIQGILAPLALAFVLSQVLGDALGGGGFDPTFVIADEDTFGMGTQIERVLDDAEFDWIAAASSEEARAAVDEGDADAGFVVPTGFGAAVQAGGAAELIVLGNVGAEISTLIAEAIAESMAAEVGAVQLSVAAAIVSGGGDAQVLAGEAAGRPFPVSVGEAVAGNRQLDTITYYSVGLAIFFLFFTVQDGVLSILEERREGTMARLLAAPLRPASLIVGKSLSSLVTGLVSMAVLVVATTLLLDADWGNPIGVVILSVAGVLAAMSVSIAVGSVANTAEQAQQFAAIVAIVLGLLGGVFFPTNQTGGTFAVIGKISPHHWLMRGFGDNAGTGTLGDVLAAASVVLLFTAVVGSVGLIRRAKLGVTA